VWSNKFGFAHARIRKAYHSFVSHPAVRQRAFFVGMGLILMALFLLVMVPWSSVRGTDTYDNMKAHAAMYKYFYGDDEVGPDDFKHDPYHHQLLLALERNQCAGHKEKFMVVVRVPNMVDRVTTKRVFLKDLERQITEGYAHVGCVRVFVFNTDSSDGSNDEFAAAAAEAQSKFVNFIGDRQGKWNPVITDGDIVTKDRRILEQRERVRDIIYMLRMIAVSTESEYVLYLENDGVGSLCADAMIRTSRMIDQARLAASKPVSIIMAPSFRALLIRRTSMLSLTEDMENYIHSHRVHKLLADWRNKNGHVHFVSSGQILKTDRACNAVMEHVKGLDKSDWFNYDECGGAWVYPCRMGQRRWGMVESLNKWMKTWSAPGGSSVVDLESE